MSNIYTSADQLIGNTPLLELTHLEEAYGLKAAILAKLEYLNPAGSVKDRIAKAMIDDAEQKGLLKKGSVSLSRPPATRALALPPSLPRADTALLSSCRRPCPSSAAS